MTTPIPMDIMEVIRRKKLQSMLEDSPPIIQPEAPPSPLGPVNAPLAPHANDVMGPPNPDPEMVLPPAPPAPTFQPPVPQTPIPEPIPEEAPPQLAMPGPQPPPEPSPAETMGKTVQALNPLNAQVPSAPSRGPSTQDDIARLEEMIRGRSDIHDFHPSKKRNIGAMLAGAATGALTFNPFVGAKVYKNISTGPYQQQREHETEQEQGLLEIIKAKRGEQTSQEASAKMEAERQENLAQASQAEATAELNRATAEQQRVETGALPRTLEERMAENRSRLQTPRAPSIELLHIMTKKGENIHGAYVNPTTRKLERDGVPIKIDWDDIMDVVPEVNKETKDPGNLGIWRRDFIRDNGRDPTAKETMRAIQEMSPPSYDPSARVLTALKLDEEQTKRAEKPSNVDYWVKQVAKNPDLLPNVPKELQKDVYQQWSMKTGLPPVAKPISGETQKLEKNSMISMSHALAIEQMIKDNPGVLDRLGPWLGRLGEFEQYVGGTIPGVPPEKQMLAAELRARFRSFLLQEAASTTGGRTGKYILDRLAQATPESKDVVPILLGKLKAVKGVSRINLNTGAKLRFGASGVVLHNNQEIPRYTMIDDVPVIWNNAQKRYVEIQ